MPTSFARSSARAAQLGERLRDAGLLAELKRERRRARDIGKTRVRLAQVV